MSWMKLKKRILYAQVYPAVSSFLAARGGGCHLVYGPLGGVAGRAGLRRGLCCAGGWACGLCGVFEGFGGGYYVVGLPELGARKVAHTVAQHVAGAERLPERDRDAAKVISADEMEAMSHGVAHFKTTSSWDGNIGLCSHNVNFDLTDGYFKSIHTLQAGDIISYATALGSRTYAVETVAEISETDWSYLGRTEDNRVTLITCISGRPRSRLVVQAVATA